MYLILLRIFFILNNIMIQYFENLFLFLFILEFRTLFEEKYQIIIHHKNYFKLNIIFDQYPLTVIHYKFIKY